MSGTVIQLVLHGFCDETMVININENDSIAILYAVVARRTGIETKSMKLFRESKQLVAETDGRTMYLKDYGLQTLDSILMTVSQAVGLEEKRRHMESSERETTKQGPPILVDDDDLELRLLEEKKAQLEATKEATKARLEKEKKKEALMNEIRQLEAETKALSQQWETLERRDIIQIFLKGINGKTFTIDINKDASIEDLFVAASERTNIHDRDSMRLLHCSKDLRTHENYKKMHLKDYNLKNLSTVYMVLRLRGGSQQERRFTVGARLTDLPDMLQMDDDQEKRALMPCGHAIGPNSLVMFCSSQVESGKFDFRCPDPTCGKRWDYSDIRNIVHLSEKEEVCYETKLTENFIWKSLEFQECPQCKSLCEKPGKKDICVICPVCTMKKGTRYEFCWYCLKKWSSPNYQRCSNPDCDGTDPRVKYLRNVQRKEIGGVKNCPTVRACPKCGLLIEHVDKCKHMDCRCGQKFCFICLRMPINGNWQCGAHNSACNVAPVQQEIPDN